MEENASRFLFFLNKYTDGALDEKKQLFFYTEKKTFTVYFFIGEMSEKIPAN